MMNAYDRDEVENKLVIKIDQNDQAPKFSIADNISKVYGLLRIHEYIIQVERLKIGKIIWLKKRCLFLPIFAYFHLFLPILAYFRLF
jgi:hypothetical protein